MAGFAGPAAEPDTGVDVVVACWDTRAIHAGIRYSFLCTMAGAAGPDTCVDVAVAYFGTRAIPGGIRWPFLRTKTGSAGFVALGYIEADTDYDAGGSSAAGTDSAVGDGLGASAGPAISVGPACPADSAPHSGIDTDFCPAIGDCLGTGTDPAPDMRQSCAHMMTVALALLVVDLSMIE